LSVEVQVARRKASRIVSVVKGEGEPLVDEKYDMVRFVLDLNEEKGITVLLIEHDLKVVMEVTPRVVVMHQGMVIADGPPLEVAAAPKVIEAYIGGG
jgi:branched-chain amino acid transport system ATP-binding protein